MTIIKENSMSFDNEINLSNSIDYNKNSTEEISKSFKSEKKDSLFENKFVNLYSEHEVEILDCQPLYQAIMEWVLKKNPSNLETPITIDDTDKIDSTFLVVLIMNFYKNCSHELKPKILQDLIMLIKWNQSNCNILLDSAEFCSWLVEVLLHQQILLMEPEAKTLSTVNKKYIFENFFNFYDKLN